MDRLVQYVRNIAYGLLVAILAPWIVFQAVRNGKYRAGFREKFLGHVPFRGGVKPCIWLHAVSVGEVNIVATIRPMLRQAWPGHDLYITTTTRTGYSLAKKKFSSDNVSYAPLDFSWAVRCAIRRIRPTALILMELELWPNLIEVAGSDGIGVAIVNGRLSEKSFAGYSRFRWLLRRTLQSIDLVAAQSPTYAARFVKLGVPPERVVVTGNVKFDGAEFDRENRRTEALRRIAGIRAQDRVFVAGSTQSPEELVAIAAYREASKAHPELKMLIVPRHAERFDDVARLLDESGVAWSRRSGIKCSDDVVAPVILVDTIGELAAWWGVADVAFVGGSLGDRGGQNMIEPAAFGAAVCFGPNTKNFRDVTESLLANGAAQVVHDADELADFLVLQLEKISNSEFSETTTCGKNAAEFVRSQMGATKQTQAVLAEFVLPMAKDSRIHFDAPPNSATRNQRRA